ncbi:MAG: hypothetical protein ACU4EQ_04890 [Candidatus Nitrosoglobus sp.]
MRIVINFRDNGGVRVRWRLIRPCGAFTCVLLQPAVGERLRCAELETRCRDRWCSAAKQACSACGKEKLQKGTPIKSYHCPSMLNLASVLPYQSSQFTVIRLTAIIQVFQPPATLLQLANSL